MAFDLDSDKQVFYFKGWCKRLLNLAIKSEQLP